MLAAGCASIRQSRPGSSQYAPRTYVEVDNRGLTDMTIYVIEGGQRIRLGLASGNARTELPIPPHIVSHARRLQFLADPIGSRRNAISDSIHVERGDRVTLIIPPS